jgi:L-aspartate oxidase
LIELRNLLQVSELIVISALQRKESRGLHYSKDYPLRAEKAVDTVIKLNKKS